MEMLQPIITMVAITVEPINREETSLKSKLRLILLLTILRPILSNHLKLIIVRRIRKMRMIRKLDLLKHKTLSIHN